MQIGVWQHLILFILKDSSSDEVDSGRYQGYQNQSFGDDDYIDESIGECHPYFHSILVGTRFGLSSRGLAFTINSVLMDLGITDTAKFVHQNRVLRLKKKLGIDAINEHEQEKKKLVCLRYDGKTSLSALPNCKQTKTHYITTVDGDGDYIHHFKSGEGAREIAKGVLKVIMDTESEASLLAIGAGKLVFTYF